VNHWQRRALDWSLAGAVAGIILAVTSAATAALRVHL
jgi:hypothetical protein